MTATTINLESLLDLSAKLVESNDVEYILNTALLSLMGKLRVSRACALIADGSEMRAVVVKGNLTKTSFAFVPDSQTFDCEEMHAELFEQGLVLCAPIRSKGVVRGALVLGPSLGSPAYNETERHYVSLVSMISAHALQSAEQMHNLLLEKSIVESRNQLLESLFEMSNDLGSLFTREQILQIFSFRLMGQVMVSRFALLTFRPDGSSELAFNRFHIDFDASLVGALRSLHDTVDINTWAADAALVEQLRSCGTELLVPLFIKNESRGILIVGKKMVGSLSAMDRRFIEALGSTLATALENARLFEEELKKQRIESELAVARQIQHKLFPETLPTLERTEIAARNVSSQQVGGDYFDVIKLGDDKVLLAIADVSGKGMPASILMANVQAALRILSPLGLQLSELVDRLNELLVENTAFDKFVTFFIALYDARTRVLQYCNAGHNPPLLVRDGKVVEELGTGGLILGVMSAPRPYEQASVDLRVGDRVFMFTDGVNEAMNANLEEFGDAAIHRLLEEHRHASASAQLQAMFQAVHQHAADAPQSDDITMVILRAVDEQARAESEAKEIRP